MPPVSSFLQTLEHDAENLVEADFPSADGVRKVLGALVKRVEQLTGIADTVAPEPEPGADPVAPLPADEPPTTPTVPDAAPAPWLPAANTATGAAPDAPAPGVEIPDAPAPNADTAAILAAVQGLAASVADLKAEVDTVKAEQATS